MVIGFSGNLVSEQCARSLIDEAALPDTFRRSMAKWWARHSARLGPASSVRALYASASDLLSCLDFKPVPSRDVGHDSAGGELPPHAVLFVHPWAEGSDGRWRDAVRFAAGRASPWCFCFNGIALRLVDARRTYGRRYIEFDLGSALQDERAVTLLWMLYREASLERQLDLFIDRSARETRIVCQNLKSGVLEALHSLMEGFAQRAVPDLSHMHAQALTLIYRLLFLLFAEARRVVPSWHPIYRESYSLDALCTLLQAPAAPPAIWETLQAIWRLAHAGCETDDLRVTAFNGRLFSPRETPLGDSARVDDRFAHRAVLALATSATTRGSGRVRVSYRDLGVEELGGVYEHVLDYTPRLARTPSSPVIELRPGRAIRKATGSFYTPRSLTDFLVRRTLHPLVAGAAPDAILGLRVLDPAMGSGAFLVSACRYLAAAYEDSLVRSGRCSPPDIGDRDRAGFRRAIAQRCLFGVDLNPMAVQLARLSMWLTTLAAEKPLNFLDHRLACGDSLIGASPGDLRRQPPGVSRRGGRAETLPLFEAGDLESAMQHAVPARVRLADEPDDTAAAVRDKERRLARLQTEESSWTRWRRLADLWCACWLWDGGSCPDRATYLELAQYVATGKTALSRTLADRLLEDASRIAARERFCHWHLQFPEVFFEDGGAPRADAGFDAVLGNPPWEMLRADQGGECGGPGHGQARVASSVRFVRASGIYREHQDGQPNQYQLFLERAMQLARAGGRIGLVLPWGLAADAGSAPLRRLLLQRATTDTLIAFDNSDAIFPIHRSVRFLLLTATKAPANGGVIRCRFGVREPTALDDLDDDVDQDPSADSIPLTVNLLEAISGGDLTIPYFRTRMDVALAERLHACHPRLEDPKGWGVEFGRELNATDDREHFVPCQPRAAGTLLPVLDGKHIEPFSAFPERASRGIRSNVAERLVEARRTFARWRLAYRDVASATNKLTLIAAVVPAGCVTTHTLFCLRTMLRRDEQEVLCALLNSYVANYLVRLRVSSHVSVGIMKRVPVPRPDRQSAEFLELASLTRRLANAGLGDALFDHPDYIRLQCIVARLYGLTPDEFEYVLGTFPLIDSGARADALRLFKRRNAEIAE